MTDLLEFVLERHGGLENWRKVTSVDARLNLSGLLFEIKQHPSGLRSAHMKVDTRRIRNMVVPFPERGKRGVLEAGAVRIESDAGEQLSTLSEPRRSYEGHVRATPWTDLQYLYFIGYAFWNYFNTPFLLARNGVTVREANPWEEHGQTWRVLDATFDRSIDTHCAEQKFYFDDNGILMRHDYFTDVGRGNVAHYCFDSRIFDGFTFPTRRRVVRREADGTTALTGPSSVWIEIESIVVNRQDR